MLIPTLIPVAQPTRERLQCIAEAAERVNTQLEDATFALIAGDVSAVRDYLAGARADLETIRKGEA